MKAVVQRVAHARVEVSGETIGAIERGLLVYLGVAEGDTLRDLDFVSDKVSGLRIFEDDAGKMNLSVDQIGGGILVVSQFTLLGDTKKGRRPSFGAAMAPGPAEQMYEAFNDSLRKRGLPVATGRFRADMKVSSLNDGPVTLLIDSRESESPRSPGATPSSDRGS
ncbi:MAG: D-tyrosyl-tRNA(Tyr) deacylase [Myxococcales bacterium]|nr:D-tyrosyl-tRNA(Tyr) deacylase [Myxococcales bacterium]MBL8716060.1 D-tyrosyl-tRNA(Tyr) deacylase [Myxococcales bacterium]